MDNNVNVSNNKNSLKINIKSIIKAISLVLIVMFFFPLFSISCQGKTVKFSAAKLTTGYSFQGQKLLDGNIICSLLIIIPIAVLVSTFVIKKFKILNLVSGISGLINIIILLAIIRKAEAETALLEFKLCFGFYLSFLLNLILIALAVCVQLGIIHKVPILQIIELPDAVPRVCSQCGAILKADFLFCGECGKKYEEVAITSEPEVSIKHCPNCGAEMEKNAKFCAFCGFNIKEDASGEKM